MLDCGDLLRVNVEAGGEKKPYCDAIIRECIALVEKILYEKEKLMGGHIDDTTAFS